MVPYAKKRKKKSHFNIIQLMVLLLVTKRMLFGIFGCHIDAAEQQRALNFKSLVSD